MLFWPGVAISISAIAPAAREYAPRSAVVWVISAEFCSGVIVLHGMLEICYIPLGF